MEQLTEPKKANIGRSSNGPMRQIATAMPAATMPHPCDCGACDLNSQTTLRERLNEGRAAMFALDINSHAPGTASSMPQFAALTLSAANPTRESARPAVAGE